MDIDIDIAETIDQLKKMEMVFEAQHVTTFLCFRHCKEKGDQKVMVEIRDAGPSRKYDRYTAVATRADGKATSGNSADTVLVALVNVHWDDLDK